MKYTSLIITCSALALSGCCCVDMWPSYGQGGMAEHSYDNVGMVYSEMDVIELGRKIYRAKINLEDLDAVGAGEHYPAAYQSIKSLLDRSMREYHGRLYRDADLDLIIVNELMHKLDHAMQRIKI